MRLFKPKHLPRLVHENKIIAIETHLELLNLDIDVIFNSKELIKDFNEEIKTIKHPVHHFCLIIVYMVCK